MATREGVVGGAVKVTALRAMALTVLIIALLLVHPSTQFTLLRPHGRAEDAISAPTGKLVAADNANTSPTHSLRPSLHQQPRPPPPSDSTLSPAATHTSLISGATHKTSSSTNDGGGGGGGGENFFPTPRPSHHRHHRFGKTPTPLPPSQQGKKWADYYAEGVLNGRESEGSTLPPQPKQTATGADELSRAENDSDESISQSQIVKVPQQQHDIEEVVQVVVEDSDPSFNNRFLGIDISGEKPGVVAASASEVSWNQKGPKGERQSSSLQQQAVVAAQRAEGDPHVSKMVLTAIGSLTAVLGVCVMAAIFQCCCRRRKARRSDHSTEEEKEKGLELKGRGGGGGSHGGSSRSSKSTSPHKEMVSTKDRDGEETNAGLLDQDAVQGEEDEDVGDFSAVQRETSILRSYRKPPPPKNRARASRVPRALKAVDPKASPTVFQELVTNDHGSDDRDRSPQKAGNGLTTASSENPDMQSSMLADIDNTLAALHTTNDSSPQQQSLDHSREPSAEKLPANEDSHLKPPGKAELPASSSREQLAKALAQELSRSASKEMLVKPQSKSGTPKGGTKETTPKSQSAGASPKPVHSSKNVSASTSKDSVQSGSNSDVGGVSKTGSSPEEGDKSSSPDNFFALIDPTAKDKDGDAGAKSKIPVRSASSPTQPTAPLRLSVGKDKRFPVPSVHGDQMDQLMKSLKTRLKDDDGASPKPTSKNVSSQDSAHGNDDEELDPQNRDRSHSDPTQQQDDRGGKLLQTQL